MFPQPHNLVSSTLENRTTIGIGHNVLLERTIPKARFAPVPVAAHHLNDKTLTQDEIRTHRVPFSMHPRMSDIRDVVLIKIGVNL